MYQKLLISIKEDVTSHLDILKVFCPFVKNGSESEERSSNTTSSTMLDQDNQENHQPKSLIADDGHAKENDSSSVFPLGFEVSQNTGRIHLYSCIPGKDPRPRPHFQNFRPEEIEASDSSPGINKEKSPESITDDPVHVLAILEFMKEWKSLRPIEKRKLLGKPLQLPLSLELRYLSESTSHNSEGRKQKTRYALFGDQYSFTAKCSVEEGQPTKRLPKKRKKNIPKLGV